jgi:predicted ABC-class ATPase
MPSYLDLRRQLLRLDRQGYRGYRSIEGEYRFPHFTLIIAQAQADPFAPPSMLRVRMDLDSVGYPADLIRTRVRRVALADFIARVLARSIRALDLPDLHIDAGEQSILERTAVDIGEEGVEVRFTARLPAAGRTILGADAAVLLVDRLQDVVCRSVPYGAIDRDRAMAHIHAVEDAQALRTQLREQGLVAFVADGSCLPRRSGADDRPMIEGAVLFQAPEELRVTLAAPHAGTIGGMGIPQGVTLIVGGGYHGKTTLLQALQVGVYDHVPGDGREQVVTVPDAVKVRAEDGRSVQCVDVSPFLSNLPFAADTACFSTGNASGSTSQAAGIMEAVEVGTHLLLLDEDTSATNFLMRDDLMQRLVPRNLEPITPYIDRVRELRDSGVSTVLVVGGNGDYFKVADHVILMERYRPRDVTEHAHRIVSQVPERRQTEPVPPYAPPRTRVPLPRSLDAQGPQGRTKARAADRDEIRYGREEIDLGTIDQLVDDSQTRAVAACLLFLSKSGLVDGERPLASALDALESRIERDGLAAIGGNRVPGNLARPRRHEVAAALNRLRSLEVHQVR